MKRLLIAAVLTAAPAFTAAQPAGPVDYDRDVKPLLREKCTSCHGATQQYGDLRLDRRQVGGGNGVAIVAGNAERSRLVWRISGSVYGPQMPPTGPLRPDQIATITAWIDQGAPWPDADGSDVAPPSDARAVRLLDAFRTGDRRAIAAFLADRALADVRGADGNTPLMYASLYGEPQDLRLLLDHGANPNAHNRSGVTALMWAAGDAAKVQLLLDRAADPRTRSADGRTALHAAAEHSGSGKSVRLLLAHGADAATETGSPTLSALALAAAAADEDTLTALLAAGAVMSAPIAEAALLNAAVMDCRGCIDVLAARTASASALGAAVEGAAMMGKPATLAHLLDKGAPVGSKQTLGLTPLMLAAYSERDALEKVTMLLAHGANPAEATASGETAMTYASRKGDRAVLDALERASGAADSTRLRTAVEKSIALLQKSDVIFVKSTGCISCHHEVLPAMLVSMARGKHMQIDADVAQRQLTATAAYLDDRRERVLQGLDMPGSANGTAYMLIGLDAQGYAPTPTTDAMVSYIRALQLPDGRFRIGAPRPPLEASDVTATATSLRAISRYAPTGMRADADRSLRAAAAWLASARADTTEDKVFRLLGLAWAGADRNLVTLAGRQLTADQRTNGGWGQLATLDSDAYSTGQALFALHEAGIVTAADAIYRSGVSFLLNTQQGDGSWLVKSRTIPFQVYFESGFPHGRDQWISAAGTSWAAIALTIATP